MNKGQSKFDSVVEVVVNNVLGFVIALAAQRIIFPLYGIENSYSTDAQIVIIFTFVSLVRGYVVRRIWNAKEARKRKL